MGVKGRTFNDSSEYYSERIRMLEKELEESNEKNKNYVAANEKLEDDYRIARNEIELLNIANYELNEKAEFNRQKFEEYFSAWKDLSKAKDGLERRFKKAKEDFENRIMSLINDKTKLEEQVKFHKQKYDMAIATPTPTAAFEEEIKQLKDKVVLWKKDAEKSKEEAQKFREQFIEEANMKEKHRNEFNIIKVFYEAEKERAKNAEEDCQKLLEELKKEKGNSEYFSEKVTKANKTIREMEKEIQKISEESNKWKNAYSQEFKSKAEYEQLQRDLEDAISSGQIVTGILEVAEEFKLPEVFAVMKVKTENPELFSNPVEAIQRAEDLNKENEPYSASTIRILKVK